MDLRRTTVVALFVMPGCLLPELDVKPPPAVDGYPRVSGEQAGKAELLLDGDPFVTEDQGGTTYNVEGGFEDQLRAEMSFDYGFDLEFREVDEGVYTVAAGDLEVQHSLGTADRGCGSGDVTIVGRRGYDSGLFGDKEFIWGTIQVEICDMNGGTADITGRFTSIIEEN